MHNLALQKVKRVVASLDLRGVRYILDLGGGPGTYAMALARKGRQVTIMDFPDTLKIARKLIHKSGLSGSVRLLPGDFTSDTLGTGYDLIFISQIFHAYDEAACISMLRKSCDALNPGGKVIVQEFLLNETRTAPLQGALFAINMLVNTPDGRTYTPQEMTAWIKKAGFIGIKTTFLDETVLIEGVKKR
jgi:cyclopropane fatty-acyl-phospholipid synthase-like methyltransferase